MSSTTLPGTSPRATISWVSGNALERHASPDVSKASLFQPLAEFGNAGRAFSVVPWTRKRRSAIEFCII